MTGFKPESSGGGSNLCKDSLLFNFLSNTAPMYLGFSITKKIKMK